MMLVQASVCCGVKPFDRRQVSSEMTQVERWRPPAGVKINDGHLFGGVGGGVKITSGVVQQEIRRTCRPECKQG